MLPTVAAFLRSNLGIPDEDDPNLTGPRPYTDAAIPSSDWDAAQQPSTPADWSQPVQQSGDTQTYSEPPANAPLTYDYQIADGRTAPPTPGGAWEPWQVTPTPAAAPQQTASVPDMQVLAEDSVSAAPAPPRLPAGRIDYGRPVETGIAYGPADPAPPLPSAGELLIQAQGGVPGVADMGPQAQRQAGQAAIRAVAPPQPAVRPQPRYRQEPAEEAAAQIEQQPVYAQPQRITLPGESGRTLTEAATQSARTNQTVSPVAVYEAFSAIPFDVYAAVRRQIVSDAEQGRMTGTDPLAPFRGLAADYGVTLPSVEDINPEGRPAGDVVPALIMSGLLPDPTDPLVGMAFRGAGRAIGATRRRVGQELGTLAQGAEAAGRVWREGPQGAARLPQGEMQLGSGLVPERASEIEQRAIREFGTTTNMGSMGYVLRDGTGLDFSGGTGVGRGMDHRSITSVIDGPTGTPGMRQFMGETGAVRVSMNNGRELSMDIPNGLSPQQRQMLMEEARYAERVYLDITDPKTGERVGGQVFTMPQDRGRFNQAIRGIPDHVLDEPSQKTAERAAKAESVELLRSRMQFARDLLSGKQGPVDDVGREYYRRSYLRDAEKLRALEGGDSAGSGLIPSSATVRNAAQGGAIGAASEMTSDEELTPEQRLARIGMGAALGVGAGRAARRGAGAAARLGSGFVPDEPRPRLYHGTASAFETPDPSKFDRNGLYGPGYYLTDNPTVAGSYADARNYADGGITPLPTVRASRLQDELARAERELASPRLPADERAMLEARTTQIRSEMERVTSQGPNVRPVDVADPLNLFDIDRQYTDQDVQFVRRWLAENVGQREADDFLAAVPGDTSGNGIYRAIQAAVGDDAARVNELLARAGFDGVAHRGGGTTPILDAAGNPIDHNVTVVFPDSLRKLKNAAGERGGAFLPGDPTGAAIGAGAGGMSDEEGEFDPQRAAMGAVIGAVAGPKARGNRAAQSANPHIRNMARQMQGQYNPSGVAARPLAERIVAALTDKNAIAGNVEQEIAGRIRAAGGTPPVTRLAERVRANPNSIAAQRAREELAPSLQQVGEDADWLEQYLVHRHNLDVARAKGDEAYAEAIARGRTPQQAQAIADRVRQSRMFSGGMTEQDIIQALADIPTEIGPARFQAVVNAAQAFWDAGRKSLDESLAEGMIDQQRHQLLTTRYPHYVRTDIADYFERGPAGPTPGGKTMGVSDIGIKSIGREGTSKDRVNPILSTIDALYAHEQAVVRNAAGRELVTLRDADQTARQLFKEVAPDVKTHRANRAETVPPDYTLRGGEQKLTVWENGQARQFVIPGEYAQLLTPRQGALLGDSTLARGLRTFFNIWKSVITTHNPGFQFVVSPLRDAGDYVAGEATRSATRQGVAGAAQAVASVPGVIADYVKALPAAFEGLGRGQFSQEVADLRRAGAGFEGRPMRSDQQLRQAYRDLQRTGGMSVSSPEDALRAARTLLTLGAEPIGSRFELVPRIAAARRAGRRGADELGRAIASKDATIDFLRGGWLTQQLNVVTPFLNPTVQSAAQVARLARKNPAAFTAAVATGIGVPAMLADAWNRSDEQRANDYANVPDHIRNGGIVFMLPSELGVDGSTELGERKPNYLWLPLGSFAFAARLAREGMAVADPVTGLTPSPEKPGQEVRSVADAALRAADLGGELLAMFSPVKGDDLSSAVASLVPPVASEIMEIGVDKDFYRGNQIATERRDERASTLSRGAARAINAATGSELRPSQVEHFTRGVGGYGATVAHAASDMAAGRDLGETRPIQGAPVVGGLVSRVVRDTGGQRLEDARTPEARAPESIRPVLSEAGMRTDQVRAVPFTYRGAKLTQDEQQRWQEAANVLIVEEVLSARDRPGWDDPTQRQKLVQEAVSRAVELARREALADLTDAEIRERIEREQSRKAS